MSRCLRASGARARGWCEDEGVMSKPREVFAPSILSAHTLAPFFLPDELLFIDWLLASLNP